MNISCHLVLYQRSLRLLLLLLLSSFSRVQLCVTPQTAAHQASPSWDSPGKNIGVGCHFLLQCMKVKSESEVAQSCPTLSNPMDCNLPGFSIHGFSRQEYFSTLRLPQFFSFFYFILLSSNYFHYFIFQLNDAFFCFRYSAIDSF